MKLPASSSSSRVRKSKKGGSGAGGVDLIISASIAEPKARVKAVRELVRLVSEKGGRKSVEDMVRQSSNIHVFLANEQPMLRRKRSEAR